MTTHEMYILSENRLTRPIYVQHLRKGKETKTIQNSIRNQSWHHKRSCEVSSRDFALRIDREYLAGKRKTAERCRRMGNRYYEDC